ncbi:response regulator transcription factor [Martelella endophytica]|uniref:response regulator transcription factor n=1 Tax=Martelella endophytica TaxID=1486262 RepID=UPI0006969E94|nr:response regulator [Martelella endophytica]
MLNIAIVEDDDWVRLAYEDLLRSHGCNTWSFSSAEDYLASAGAEYDCLILDIQLPGMDGLELLARLRGAGETMPVVVISSHNEEQITNRAMQKGATLFLGKPFRPEALIPALETATGRSIGG